MPIVVKYTVAFGLKLTFLTTLLLFFYAAFEHRALAGNKLYLSSLDQFRSADLVPFEPFSILDNVILEYRGNSEEAFLDALQITDDSFFIRENSCACKLLVMDFSTGLYVLRHIGNTTVRLVFKLEEAGPNLVDATITHRTL